MNIIIREMKLNLKSLVIWSISLVFVFLMMLSEFSAYYNNPKMSDILDSMPPALLEAFGMSNANLTTVSGYMSITGVYINLMLSIFAILLGNALIAKEERYKTAGFLMTLPRSRQKIVAFKMIAGLLNCVIVISLVYITILMSTLRYNPDQRFYHFIGLMGITSVIFTGIFYSLGLFYATVFRRYKRSSAMGLVTVFVLYLISIIIGLWDKIDFLKYVTPFKYFEAPQLLETLQIDRVYLAISFMLILIFIGLAFKLYSKRDLLI